MPKDILLVDDDNEARDMLGKFIERRGIKVFMAKNGAEALDSYKKNRPSCVFLDVRLPDMDGVTIFLRIREIDSNATIYFVTGSTDGFYFQKKVKELGADGFLSKPLVLDDIIEVINKIV